VVFRQRVSDLLLASWEADPERVARALPPGLVPAQVDGRHVVTIAGLRSRGGTLGRLPVPPFSQLNVRAYAEYGDGAAVCFLALRVTPAGMAGALFGFPVRPARIHVREGLVEAPGLGVRIAYERRGPSSPSELAGHETGLFEAAGLRELRVRRGETRWERAEAAGPVRADPLVALGFGLDGPPSLLYAAGTTFESELPPRRVQG
jgi:hypothetical protein